MTVRDGRSQPFALRRAAVAARPIGGGPGFVDEDQLLRIEIELTLEPGLPPLQNVGPLLLGRVRGLFLSVSSRRSKKRQIVDTLKWWPFFASAA